MHYIGIGITSLALIGVAIALSIIFSTYITCILNQPSIQPILFQTTIISFAFIEAIALLSITLAFSIF